MDLNSIMNGDGATPTATSGPSRASPPEAQRRSMQQPPPRQTSAHYDTAPVHHQQHAPQHHYQQSYPPPPPTPNSHSRPLGPVDSRHSSQPQLTPLRTASSQSQYSQQSQIYQSPGQPQHPSYRSHDGLASATPGARPASSFAYQSHQHSPSQLAQSAHFSASPTPSMSGHVHTPYAVRESPLSVSSLTNPSYPPPPAQQPSQPSTPLAPPSLLHNRQSAPHTQSTPYPLHQRTFSGQSAGHAHSIASNSPAQPHPSTLAYRSESPARYASQTHDYKRRSTGYLSNSERERSLSVSPKTKIPMRHPSDTSRPSSQEAWAARPSLSAPQHDYGARPQNPENVSSPTAITAPASARTGPGPPVSGPPSGTFHQSLSSPLSQQNNHSRYQSLTPSVTHSDGLDDHRRQLVVLEESNRKRLTEHAPTSMSQSRQDSQRLQMEVDHPQMLHKSSEPSFPSGSLLQQPLAVPVVKPEFDKHAPSSVKLEFASESLPAPPRSDARQAMPLKRPADHEPESKPMVKRAKRRYHVPPIWAALAPSNPRYDGKNPQSLQATSQTPRQAKRPSPRPGARAPPAPQSSHASQPRPSPQTNQSNGHQAHPQPQSRSQSQMADGSFHSKQIQDETAKIREALGVDWEVSFTNTEPADDFLTTICNFLFVGMLSRGDVGAGDASVGGLEIEAKLGTLIDRQTNDRLSLPVTTTTALHPEFSKRLRFESFMTETQHKSMNEHLNACVQKSMKPPRVPMQYKHRYEQDSFATLSDAGLAALPAYAHKYNQPGHTLRLRTTLDMDPKRAPNTPAPVIARIVKLRLADLDIYAPLHEFDCRLSINIEMDLQHLSSLPDFDTEALTVPVEREKERQPERHKNRLSYRHLAYSIDLTQVTQMLAGTGEKGAPASREEKTHELEIEVDARLLRDQAVKLQKGEPNAFEPVVKGLLDNVVLLMRFKPPEEAHFA